MTLLASSVQLTLPITDPVLIVAISATIFLVVPLVTQSLRLPSIIGLILAGAIVGPNGLHLLARSNTIVLLGTVGLLYLMFIAGIEIDLHEFKRYRGRSVIFGALTFLLPQTVGTAVMLGLGYDLPSSLLIASMFASHTLLAYPIALRLGVGKNQAVTTTVGGTIITDTAALLVLAVIAASTEGSLDVGFWLRLAIGLGIYVSAVWILLPRIARALFRSERTGAVTEYVFVFAALFVGAYLAEVAGVEAIVGAFLVGLALNSQIPEHSVLANRVHFVGEAIFIPFFLLSVGMLVDTRVLFGGPRVWQVMLAMTATVIVTKWFAAWLSGRWFGYSSEQWWTMFGLSIPQAAATLAAALIGVEIGLFDEAVLNGTILMILVTCVIGPWVVERFGRRLALEEERAPQAATAAPQRILVPMANPATARVLLDLALSMREPESREAIYPLTVVPEHQEGELINVALAEKMLNHAVSYGSALDVPVTPITRVDHNFANGIRRGAIETRSSMIIVGWDARRSTRHAIFGTVLDQLLEQTRQHVIVAKLGHPLNTTRRLLLLIPRGSDRIPGFHAVVRVVKLMANRLSASIDGYVVAGSPEDYLTYFKSTKPDAPVALKRLESWRDIGGILQADVQDDDLIVLLSARQGTVSWHPALTGLPGLLAELASESFLVIYPAEVSDGQEIEPETAVLPRVLTPERVVVGLRRGPHAEAIAELLSTQFETEAEVHELVSLVVEHEDVTTAHLRPGVVVPHIPVPDLPEPLVFLGISGEGIDFPNADAPANLVFLILTPQGPRPGHLRLLGEVANLVNDPHLFDALRNAESPKEVASMLGLWES